MTVSRAVAQALQYAIRAALSMPMVRTVSSAVAAARPARHPHLRCNYLRSRRRIGGKLPQFWPKSPCDWSIAPCTSPRWISIESVMTDKLEKKLIEALERVEAQGDVAPAHVHDPMTMLLRENAIQAHLMRWDDDRGRYVVTGTGRRRMTAGSRASGRVISFRRRGIVAGDASQLKAAKGNVKE
jgi:hypothetical protein